jgi:hypothetical protein
VKEFDAFIIAAAVLTMIAAFQRQRCRLRRAVPREFDVALMLTSSPDASAYAGCLVLSPTSPAAGPIVCAQALIA